MWSGIDSSWSSTVRDLVAVPRALDLGEVEREQVAGDQLGQEALGRRDADLGAGVGVDHRVGLARDGRAVGVADRQHPRPLRPGVPDRLQRVGGLAGLADRHHQRGVGQDRVAVAELGGQLDLDRDPGPVLDGVLRDHAGVERRAAGDDDDLVDVAQVLVGQPHLVELQLAPLAAPAEQRVGHRPRLLVDLLAHEPVVAVLLGRRQVPVDVVAAALGRRVPSKPVTRHAVAGDRHDLVLAELHRLAGVLDERGDVGAEEVLALADADHERRVAAGGDDPGRVGGIDGDQGERALEPRAHPLHRGRSGRRRPSTSSSSSWAATSVSVSETSSCPASSSSVRSATKFSMIPLCTSATRPVPPGCGCALTSLGAPCVAQRVCPMPVEDSGSGSSAIAFSRLASLPARFAQEIVPSATRATPAES